MDNHMDNNPNGNRPDNNKGPGRQARTRIISRYWPFWYASW
mgnify:CR=1 FL=1